jgi:hypothetical protein
VPLVACGIPKGRRSPPPRGKASAPEAVQELTHAPLVVLSEAVARDADGCLDRLVAAVLDDDFRRFFTEDALLLAHQNELRAALDPELYEVHAKLAVAGSGTREFPDLSVIHRLPARVERRGVPAVYSAEYKFFSYRGTAGGFRLTDRLFGELVKDVRRQFARLAERRRRGMLGGGVVIWVDAFDWLGRFQGDVREVIQERSRWLDEELSRDAGTRMRFEYVPVCAPELRLSLGGPLRPSAGRSPGSLRGAAVPFIRRWPTPDEDWDEAIAEAVAEEYLARQGNA